MSSVLLIDDHAMFREGLTLALVQADPTLQIHCVASGLEALQLIQSETTISTVMMDYYLPDIGGGRCCSVCVNSVRACAYSHCQRRKIRMMCDMHWPVVPMVSSINQQTVKPCLPR